MSDTIYAAICDGDKKYIRILEGMVRNWADDSGYEFELTAFTDPEELKRSITSGMDFGIFIIEIANHGVDLGRYLHQRSRNAPIIYVTRSKNHALDAYSVGALRYLLKPIDYEELASALEFSCIVHRAIPKNVISVRSSGSVANVSADDVIYIENNVRSMKYVMKDGTVMNGTRRNISFEKFFAPLLDSGTFVQTHKSFIVNISRIKSMRTSSVIMSNGANIPISRRHLDEVHTKYTTGEKR